MLNILFSWYFNAKGEGLSQGKYEWADKYEWPQLPAYCRITVIEAGTASSYWNGSVHCFGWRKFNLSSLWSGGNRIGVSLCFLEERKGGQEEQ